MAAITSGAETAPADPAHELWRFPPMFTIQRNVEVRERQLGVWEEIILSYHRVRQQYLINMTSDDVPYFVNKAIDRALSKHDIEIVLGHLVETGHGEWLDDPVRSQFLVMWDTAQQVSNEIYAWAQDTGKVGEIYTVYDIHSEDDSVGRGFHGAHPRIIVKALAKLQEGGKAKIYRDDGKSVDEWGVKFLP
jgi:ESCRT-II complex subunit VPS25